MMIGALMFVLLIGVSGLAIDAAFAYTYSVALERAAASAALAGVPYLPQSYNLPVGGPNAQTRATAEAKRNQVDPTNAACKCSISFGLANNNQNLVVAITKTVPTFFMQALGVNPFDITRTAEAGFRAPIRLGSPDNEFGSTVSEIGSAGHFYYLWQKAWHVPTGRGEGDAYGPQNTPPYEPNPPGVSGGSTDVHAISLNRGNESNDTNFTGAASLAPFPGGWDDRGGENYRITVPGGTTGEIQVYNAAFAPDPGNAASNPCENWSPRSVGNGKCNVDSNQAIHEAGVSQCTGTCSGQKSDYNSVLYTLFQVNDTFVRANDNVLRQTLVYPLDASNYNATPPTYINAHDGSVITQLYSAGRPTNARVYHSWTNIGAEKGANGGGESSLIKYKGWNPTPSGSGSAVDCSSGTCPPLPAGTYRLRVDFLDADGNFARTGSSNHGFGVRVVTPTTQPEVPSATGLCVGTTASCTVGGWEDAVAFTPLTVAGDNFIPIFELTKDYAGSTIDVDLFDFGDVNGANNVSVIDPTQGGCAGGTSPNTCDAGTYGGVANGPGVTITNNGINRGGVPLYQHVSGANSQAPSGAVPGGADDVSHLIPASGGKSYAIWNVAYAGCGGTCKPYNGTWIRVTIPIPGNYNPVGSAFWYMRYNLTGTAYDTFSFAVSARGGPVHLLKS
jgi:hypothetical protein